MNTGACPADGDDKEYGALRNYPREAGFIDRLFRDRGLFPGPLLDLACGAGGHAVELARRGWRVMGLDLDGAMLERVRERASAAGCIVQTLAADMADFRVDEPFGGAVNLFYSFQDGLPTTSVRRDFLSCVWRALAPGGRFILDFLPEENNLRWYPEGVDMPVSRLEREDGSLVITTSTNRILGPEVKEILFRRRVVHGREQVEESQQRCRLGRLFLEPTRELFRGAGFAIEAEYGDFDEGAPFDDTCRRMVVVLRREERSA